MLMTLPPGAVIQIPTKKLADQMRAAFVNEGSMISDLRFQISEPVLLCTRSYLDERDAAEFRLHRRIMELELKGRSQ